MADWIWLDHNDRQDEYAVFKDDFFLAFKQSVRIKISVAGDYNLFVNGKLAGFGQYPDYPARKVYDLIDLTSFVRAGQNEVRIVAWHIGKSFSTGLALPAGLFYELRDENGEALACSSAGTRCALAPDYQSYREKIITVQLGYSYRYDARCANAEPCWSGAVKVEGYQHLVPRPNKKLLLGEPVAATPVNREKHIYDLGRERCGFLNLRFKAASGTLIRIVYGEHLIDGAVRDKIGIRDFSVELIANGEWVDFTGCFRRLGCRYLQVYGNCEIAHVGLRETQYPFECPPVKLSSGVRKRIYETAVDTLKLCYHEHYEDCPWREQSMYILDSFNQARCGYYAFRNPECMKAAILSFMEGQQKSGLFELCFPAEVPITIPSFSLVFPAFLLEYYEHTGDILTLTHALPYAERAIQYFLSRLNGDGLFVTHQEEGIWHFYEWETGLDGEDKQAEDTTDSLINAFLSLAIENERKLCLILGDRERAEEYQEMRCALNNAIANAFYSQETGLFRTWPEKEEYSALANALCVLAGVTKGKQAVAIADKLADGYDGWTKNTLSTNVFRFDALLKVNAGRYINKILGEIDSVYTHMLNEGATSFWETEKGAADFEGAGSLCHGWSALPVYYYHLLGVVKN